MQSIKRYVFTTLKACDPKRTHFQPTPKGHKYLLSAFRNWKCILLILSSIAIMIDWMEDTKMEKMNSSTSYSAPAVIIITSVSIFGNNLHRLPHTCVPDGVGQFSFHVRVNLCRLMK